MSWYTFEWITLSVVIWGYVFLHLMCALVLGFFGAAYFFVTRCTDPKQVVRQYSKGSDVFRFLDVRNPALDFIGDSTLTLVAYLFFFPLVYTNYRYGTYSGYYVSGIYFFLALLGPIGFGIGCLFTGYLIFFAAWTSDKIKKSY